MKKLIMYGIALFIVSIIFNANAGILTQSESSSGIKGLLNQAASSAVQQLGQQGGFSNDPQVKIGLPNKLASAARLLKMLGLGNQLTQLENNMNKAAEAAMPEAKQMLLNSIQQMTLSDAKAIITGGDKSATSYLEQTNRTQLFNKLLPKVKDITGQTALSSQYNTLLTKAKTFGIASDNIAIENYVTNKALDGLFKVIGNQESYIRNNPKQAATSVVKKILESYMK